MSSKEKKEIKEIIEEQAPNNPLDYRPSDQAQQKINEFLEKRREYVEAIEKIDSVVRQLQFGITQKIGATPQAQCNGFGVGYDHGDYACREICDVALRSACSQIVRMKRDGHGTDEITKDHERYLGQKVDRKRGIMPQWGD